MTATPDLAAESARLLALADPAPGRVLHVLCALGVADALRDGPLATKELAAAVGAEPDALGRVLRLAATLDVVLESATGGWRLRPAGLLLCTGTDGSIRAELANNDVFALWTEFAHSVRSGEPCYPKVFGAPVYERLNEEPGGLRDFHAFAHERAHRVYGPLIGLPAWPSDGVLVDLAGGTGGLAAQLLAARPGLRAVVHDFPEVLAISPLHGDPGLRDRVTFAPGDLFTSPLPDGDTYVLASVLHNWPDAPAVRILERCRETGGGLLIVDRVLSPTAPPSALSNDLLMLASCGGRERTRPEWDTLMAAAGLRITATHAAPGTDQTILTCAPT